jgi:LPXTG-site transpeptidase (sortase) family protein
MGHDAVADTDHDERQDGAPAAGRRQRHPRGAIAKTLGVLGEVLITGGAVLALFVVYSLWWTNITADREANSQGEQVRKHWAAAKPSAPGKLDTKDGIGFLHVPALHVGEILVKKGTATSVLNQGVAGYYTSPIKSAMPWDKAGNFAVAAHRDGHGAKFHNINKLKVGDPIVFETRDTWYVYKVFATLPETSKYNVHVLDRIPKQSGKKHAGRYITLSTCTPVYTSLYRYIVWGQLVRTQQVDAKRTPPKELR